MFYPRSPHYHHQIKTITSQQLKLDENDVPKSSGFSQQIYRKLHNRDHRGHKDSNNNNNKNNSKSLTDLPSSSEPNSNQHFQLLHELKTATVQRKSGHGGHKDFGNTSEAKSFSSRFIPQTKADTMG